MLYEIVGIEHVMADMYRLVFKCGKRVFVHTDGLKIGSERIYELRFHTYTHDQQDVQKTLGGLHYLYGGLYRYVLFGTLIQWFVEYDCFSHVFSAYEELNACDFCQYASIHVHLRHPAWRKLLSSFGEYRVFPYLKEDKLIPEPGVYITNCFRPVKIGDHETIDQKKLLREVVRIRCEESFDKFIPEWYIDETILRSYLEKNL